MSIVASLLKFFFGSKSEKDRQEVEPYLVEIKKIYPQIEALDNDRLRARSADLRRQIAEFIRPEEDKIAELKVRLELPEVALDEKEEISREIDKLMDRIDEKIEEKLDAI